MLAVTEAAMTTTALAKPILCEVTHANNDRGGSRACHQPATVAVGNQRQHTLTLTPLTPGTAVITPSLSPTSPLAYAARLHLVACLARMLTKMVIHFFMVGK